MGAEGVVLLEEDDDTAMVVVVVSVGDLEGCDEEGGSKNTNGS